MAKVVIIGAGLTGISTAYHLEKKRFADYEIFEKEPTIGGLCRSITQDGFTFDYTGHLLHAGDAYFRQLIEDVVGLDSLNQITRRSFIYSQERYTNFPYQVNLFGLPHDTIVECVEGYVNRTHKKRVSSFREWVLREFGAGFGKHFFFTYQEKIFAHNVDKLSASWTRGFVPQTSLKQILYGALADRSQDLIGYNAQFFYPKHGGIMSWVRKLADQIRKPIRTHYCVKRIDLKQRIVHFTNGHSEPFEQLVMTAPLDNTLDLLEETGTMRVKAARSKLLCNQVVNFNIGVNRADLSSKHWIYFPELRYPFYRIGFPHNFAQSLAPEGCSSLYGEFAHIGKSRDWVQKTLERALASAKKLLRIDKREIMTEKVIEIPHAYVIYDAWRDKHLPQLLARLKERNIIMAGRYGEWKYASMQDAILDGKRVADELIYQPARRTDWHAPSKKRQHREREHD